MFGAVTWPSTSVAATKHPLDQKFPSWGDGPYFSVELRASRPLHELLTHLYVLVPVLDDDKHYYVGDDEVDKLIRQGEGWLAQHPARELITRRYLKHQKGCEHQSQNRIDQLKHLPASSDGSDPDRFQHFMPIYCSPNLPVQEFSISSYSARALLQFFIK